MQECRRGVRRARNSLCHRLKMSFFTAQKLSLRVYLALPLALLMASLTAIVLVAQLELGGARPHAIAAPRENFRAAPSPDIFIEAAKKLARVETAEGRAKGEVLSLLSQVQTLLDLMANPTAGGPQAVAIAQMRRAAVKVATTALAEDGNGETVSRAIDAETSSFATGLAAYRQRATLPRERACAADTERHFASLIKSGESLRERREDKQEILGELPIAGESAASAALPATKAAGELHAREGAFGANLTRARWSVTLLALGSFACVLVTVYCGTRRIGGAVAHLVEVARDVTRGGRRGRASLAAAGDLRVLAEAFNGMIDARQHAEDSLKTAQSSLELKVSARTAELWRANKALREESEQRARVEGEFHQAQKMDALGKLAGSIAHDFNNLLTVIIGGSECAQKQIGKGHPALALLQTIQQAGERAAGLTQPLLTFSRNQVLAVDVLDLNVAAEEAGRMLQRLLGVNIEMKMNLAPDLKPIKANANQIQQVLVNLGVNARDAMETQGTLTISTVNATREHPSFADKAQKGPSDWVILKVNDTGCGMDAATKQRMFEPFFTTKPVGKGTGLGLATVFGIVKQLEGFLEVESAPGEGTTFHVFIPATNEVRSIKTEAAVPPPRAVSASGEKEMLLLVDDEEHIRMLATMALEERGYLVLAASHAEEAILLAEKHGGKIKALITDVVMPGINGVELAELLLKVVPGIRVLFVSGHSKEVVSTSKLLSAHNNYLQKPYRGDALIGKVHEILAGHEARFQFAEAEQVSVWMN
jgi:signal transduction histidine kinase/CheY-like chemotaxis protein